MEAELWRRIEELFNAALDLPPAERRALLQRHRLTDPELADEVESLLQAERVAEDLLAGSIQKAAREVIEARPPLAEGDRVGAYRVVKKLGEGGMGMVFLAERADAEYEARVAIKILRTGAADRRLLERFRAERQILASLEHPSVARLIDGGATDRGYPYVVMEYVDGEPLDAYCRNHGLSLRQRVELFLQVIGAVQAAHQSLIVHRDIKPGNILVTREGAAKLLDFGIAKILDAPGDADALTGPLGRVMTPDYASPEQVLGKPVGAASDIYSLGVALYELLTGAAPYSTAGMSPGELEQAVCLIDPPPPSAVAPPEVAPKLRRELDCIVLKAMAKAPEERYASAERFAADLQRYLDGRPVLARPQTWSYRTRKIIARNKLAAAAALTVFTLLIVIAVSMTLAARRIAVEKEIAERQRQRAEETARFLTEVFRISDPGETRGERVTAREVLDWSADRLRREPDTDPQLRAQLLDVIGVVYQNLGLYSEAAEALSEALELRRKTLSANDPELAAALNHLANAQRELGRYPEARASYEQSLAIARSVAPEGDAAVAQNLSDLAMLLRDQGDYDEAEGLAREALEMRRRTVGEGNAEVAAGLHNLGTVLYRRGDYQQAEELFRKALELDRKLRGDLHPSVAMGLHSLGALFERKGELDQAEASFQEALEIARELYGEQHTGVADNLRSLAQIRLEQKDPAAAEKLLAEALEIDLRMYGDEHPVIAADLNLQATAARDRGDAKRAEELFRKALNLRRKTLPPQSPPTANSLLQLGSLLTNAGRTDEAEPLLEESLEIFSDALPEDHWQVAEARDALAVCLTVGGDLDRAEKLLLANDPARPQTRRALAYLYDVWDRPTDADRYR